MYINQLIATSLALEGIHNDRACSRCLPKTLSQRIYTYKKLIVATGLIATIAKQSH